MFRRGQIYNVRTWKINPFKRNERPNNWPRLTPHENESNFQKPKHLYKSQIFQAFKNECGNSNQGSHYQNPYSLYEFLNLSTQAKVWCHWYIIFTRYFTKSCDWTLTDFFNKRSSFILPYDQLHYFKVWLCFCIERWAWLGFLRTRIIFSISLLQEVNKSPSHVF